MSKITRKSNEQNEAEADLEWLFSIIFAIIQRQSPEWRIRSIILAGQNMTNIQEKFVRSLLQDSRALGEVTRKAVRCFANEVSATVWLFAPNYSLGWQIPISLLGTEEGIELVAGTLGRIEWGTFS